MSIASLGLRASVAVGAGVALAATREPWEYRWLLPVAIAGWVASLHGSRSRQALVLGYLFGISYLLTLTVWMQVVGTDAWLLVGSVLALYFAVLGIAITWVSKFAGWPLWTACLWVGVDVAMSAWPLGGFPWARLAWAVVETPLASWLPWIGADGVTLLVALLGSALVWLVQEFPVRPKFTAATAVVVLGVVALPVVRPPDSFTDEWTGGRPTARVAVIQGGVPGDGDELVAHHRQVTRNHVQATVELAAAIEAGSVEPPDFVVWPENSTAVDPFKDERVNRGIRRAVESIGIPILVGAIVDGASPDEVLNQGIVWEPEDGPTERYTKRHPVPFGEYVPFREWLGDLDIGRLALIPRDMQPGTRSRPLQIRGVQVADLICFDVAFDDALTEQVRNGAEVVTVQTSNATFIHTNQIEQQFAISRARAMESGRTIVVAAVNGISGVIAPDGTVRRTASPRTTSVLVSEVPLTTSLTPAMVLGPWTGRIPALIGVAALVIAVATRRRGHSFAP